MFQAQSAWGEPDLWCIVRNSFLTGVAQQQKECSEYGDDGERHGSRLRNAACKEGHGPEKCQRTFSYGANPHCSPWLAKKTIVGANAIKS